MMQHTNQRDRSAMRSGLNRRAGAALLLVLSAGSPALAQFISGTGGVTYTVPPPKVLSEDALVFGSMAKIDLTQELFSASYESSPFTFINLPEVTTTLKATTDTARVKVEDRFGAVWTHQATIAAPFARDSSGFGSLWFDAGSVGDLTDPGKAPRAATGDENRARAFMVADLIDLAHDSLSAYGAGGGAAGSAMPKQKVVYAWPYKIGTKDQTSHFAWADSSLRILEADGADVDVLTHEFGHGVADKFSIAKRVGGDHGFGQTAKVPNGADKGKAFPELAWSEGIATYIGLTLQQTSPAAGAHSKLLGFGDSWYYDREDSTMSVDIERGRNRKADGSLATLKSIGIADELSTARFLWDLYDGKGEDLDDVLAGKGKKDEVALGAEKVWKVLTKPADGRAPTAITGFMDSLRKELIDTMPAGKARTQLFKDIGDLAADHALTPLALPPEKILPKGPGGDPMEVRWTTPSEIPVTFDDPKYDIHDVQTDDSFISSLEENFKWFKVGLLDPDSGALLASSAWLTAAEAAVPGTGSQRLFGMGLSQALIDQLLEGASWRWVDLVVATETSLATSAGMLPSDFFDASMWGESASIAIPAPGPGLLALTGLGLITSRRRR